jgi:hypothetical protein
MTGKDKNHLTTDEHGFGITNGTKRRITRINDTAEATDFTNYTDLFFNRKPGIVNCEPERSEEHEESEDTIKQ